MKGVLAAFMFVVFGFYSPTYAGCLESWARFLSPGPQLFMAKEDNNLGGGERLVVFEFLEFGGKDLAGEFAKRYLFAVYENGCMTRAVSLGSYAATFGPFEAGKPRKFHLDLYKNDVHATLGFFDREPPYKEVRARAIAALGG